MDGEHSRTKSHIDIDKMPMPSTGPPSQSLGVDLIDDDEMRKPRPEPG